MPTDELLLAFARATMFTSVSAIVAQVLLRGARVESPRIHRAAWLVVIVQGWLVFPCVWQIETTPAENGRVLANVEHESNMLTAVATTSLINSRQVEVDEQSTWRFAVPAIFAARLFGMTLLALSRALRYVRFVQQLPGSNSNADARWRREWQRQLRASRIRRHVELRTTVGIGPLLCFVPFRYLVLVPRALWNVLPRAEQRVILRHELAHLVRGDLWWALVIRALALPQWFNPLMWQAVRRFDEAGEWACDDLVSHRRRGRSLLFARSLLATAEYATAASPGTLGAQGGELSRRIRRLVSQRFKEETMAKNLLVLVPLVAITAVQMVRIQYVEAAPTITAVKEPSLHSIDQSLESTSMLPTYGSEPYVIEPPDELSIGRGTLIGAKRLDKEDVSIGRLVVAADGTIDLGGIGKVYVSGMTLHQAHEVIKEKLLASKKIGGVEFDLHVAAINSKKIYLILQDTDNGDSVQPVACLPNSTLDEALLSAAWPQPVDLTDAEISVHRPLPGNTGERVVRIDWNSIQRDAAAYKFYQLLPCDRVIVKVQAKAALAHKDAPTTSYLRSVTPAANSGSYQAAPIGQPIPVGTTLPPPPLKVAEANEGDQAFSTNGIYVIVQRESGDNVVALPYTGSETVLDAIAEVGEMPKPSWTKIWVARRTPNGVGLEQILPVNWEEISRGKSTATNYQLLPGDRLFIAEQDPVRRVEFDTQVVIDGDDNLAEFGWRERTPCVVIDRDPILPTLRILDKNKLIDTFSSPKLTCVSGRTALIKFNDGVPTQFQLEFSAIPIDKQLVVSLRIVPDNRLWTHASDVSGLVGACQTECLVSPGQTIVIPLTCAAEAESQSPNSKRPTVYAFVTPELLD
jgi:beta-lactamase regulating signal transducer with metallopeptidase domain